MTWAATQWGQVCADVAAFVTDLVEGYPQFSVGIGPDAEDLHDGSYRITFVPLDATMQPRRYASGLERKGTKDEVIPTRIVIQVPLDLDPATNEDRSPALIDMVWERLVEACDAVRHEPYMNTETLKRFGGKIGSNGTKYIGMATIRIERERTPRPLGTAITSYVLAQVSGPDGNGGTVLEDFEVTSAPT